MDDLCPSSCRRTAMTSMCRCVFLLRAAPNSLVVRVKNDFGLALTNELPPLGSASRGLRIISESWNASKTDLSLEVSGLAGSRYELERLESRPGFFGGRGRPHASSGNCKSKCRREPIHTCNRKSCFTSRGRRANPAHSVSQHAGPRKVYTRASRHIRLSR